MQGIRASEYDRVVFDTHAVRVGAFRCHPSQPSFHDTGPTHNCCFVFPRTAVEIQHEHEPAFVANPNVVTFYNRGQAYWRNAISPEGDRCDWFGVDPGIVREVVHRINPSVNAHCERPFRFTRGWAETPTYLLQRRIFEHVTSGEAEESLAIEEAVLFLLERVVRSVYRAVRRVPSPTVGPKQREVVHWMEVILSERLEERLTLEDVAHEVGLSVYHTCRLFRRATGTTMWQYRQKLRLRSALEGVRESPRPLVDIALECGFSSHSHFTSLFHREFGHTPSTLRARKRISSSRT